MLRKNRLRLSSLEDYYHHLITSSRYDKHNSEWRELINLLTTTESYFFRDQGQFLLLRNRVLPELIERQSATVSPNPTSLNSLNSAIGSTGNSLDFKPSIIKPELRIWSAGCSTGEEIYSIAILLRELLPDLYAWKLTLIGTDINQAALERAKKGIYSDWSFRLLNTDIRKHYFQRCGDGWQIDPLIRQMVTFEYHNLVHTRMPSTSEPDASTSEQSKINLENIHLILCRNVFIYFNQQAIAQSLSKFYQSLAPAGYLLTGHTELQGHHLGALRVRCFPESIIYQRSATLDAMGIRPEDTPGTSAMSAPTDSKAFLSGLERTIAASPTFPTIANRDASKNASGYGQSEHSNHYQPSHPIWTGASTPSVPSPSPGSTDSTSPQSPQADPSSESLQTDLIQLEHLLIQELYKDAIQSAEQLIAQHPQNFTAHALLAEAYANSGDYDRAVQTCQRAIAIAPLAVEPYYLLAQVAEERGDRNTAKRLLKQVIYLSPNAIQAYLELGALYNQDGDKAKSEKNWRSALNLLQRLPEDEVINRRNALTAAELKAELAKVMPS
jgi:chemotaxis protein methyltransferase CheR